MGSSLCLQRSSPIWLATDTKSGPPEVWWSMGSFLSWLRVGIKLLKLQATPYPYLCMGIIYWGFPGGASGKEPALMLET